MRGNSMEIVLYKMSSISWAVVSSVDDEPHAFDNIEGASDYMMSLGVEDDHIDLALVDMLAKGSIRARFANDGTFVSSDAVRLNGKVGIA